MGTIQTFLQTIWASILAFGWVKLIIVIVLIAILSRFNKLLGTLAVILFIAYLAGWL